MQSAYKKKYRKISIIAFLAIVTPVVVWLTVATVNSGGMKSVDATALGVNGAPNALLLEEGETEAKYESPAFEADFSFNAIAPHWKEEASEATNVEFELRVSDNGKDWTSWLEIEAEAGVRDNDPTGDRMFPETPMFVSGKFFQYRVALEQATPAKDEMKLYDLKMNYIDSREPELQRIVGSIGEFFAPPEAHAAQNINVISRSGWGSPDPHGNLYKGSNRYWEPAYVPAKQIFLHHTVTPSFQADPAAAVRAIWDFHANTRQWGDIGYNYLMDHGGNVYEGRFGGDNVIAGHVRNYNQGSLGVAVMGCFQPGTTCDQLNGSGNTSGPTPTTMSSLSTLLSWKTTSLEINPTATQVFCDYAGNNCLHLPTIAAHRDAGSTSCNGQYFYDQMGHVRNETKTKNDTQSWAYAAKQMDYPVAQLNANNTATITIRFKNMGTETWTNHTNPVVLGTANPPNRASAFRGDDWLSDSVLSVIEEPSVAPGQTGSFTFTVKRGFETYGSFLEDIRLIANGIGPFKNYFAFRIFADCHAGNTDPDPDGTYSSAMGGADFNGNSKGDVLWYGPGRSCDSMWRGSGISGNFLAYRVNVKNSYRPISGDFDGDGYSDILWYGPGSAKDSLWYGNQAAKVFDTAPTNVNGTYTPINGDFNGDGYSDIFWYGPGSARDSIWYGTAARGQFTPATVNVAGTYRPISGDFDGDGRTDIFWYGAGEAKDAIWYANPAHGSFTYGTTVVNGTYTPFTGDFNGDRFADVFWYGGGGGAYSSLWYGAPARTTFTPASVNVNGTYHPVPNDFNGDGRTDIIWYGPGGARDVLWYGNTGRGSFSSHSTNVSGRYIPIY